MRFLFVPVLLLTTVVVAQGKPAPDGKGSPATAAPAKAAAKTAIDFEKQILPILEKSCVDCHSAGKTGPDGRPRKPKGGVLLDGKDGMLASKKGKLIVAKKPDDSLLYKAITLAPDDEDRMPPAKKGDPLPKEQTDLIKQWIEEGASFGKWVGKKAEKADAGGDKDKEGGDKGKGKEGGDKPKTKPDNPHGGG